MKMLKMLTTLGMINLIAGVAVGSTNASISGFSVAQSQVKNVAAKQMTKQEFAVPLAAQTSSLQAGPNRFGYQYYGLPQLKMTLPPNNLHLHDRLSAPANMTEERFNQIIDQMMAPWMMIAKSRGINLTVERNWTDPTVNAFAAQSGNNWKIAMFGGLARRPEVTEDGFALVVCHELGHHFGGYAFYGNSEWGAAEGEADYFSTDVCAKYVWGQQPQKNMMYRSLNGVPDIVTQACSAAWKTNANAQGWCVRAAAGSLSLASLLASLQGAPPPRFDSPDKTQVPTTDTSHPRAQCRLDTLFQGTLCTKKWDMTVIPAKGFPEGQSSPAAEIEAMKYSCFTRENFNMGTRPLCWFKPLN
jgi:hypothetical protein